MMISFRLNRKSDNELILLLSKYENNNMSEFIRCALRNNLLTSKGIAEDPFTNNTSNTDNVEVRNINKKAEINKSNANTDNKSKIIKWNIPK